MKLTLYESGASGTAPTAPSPGSTGHPTNGVPGSVAPTTPGAYWFYQVEQELTNLLAAASITPAQGTLNQVAAAVAALIAAATSPGVPDSWPTGGVASSNGIQFGHGARFQTGACGTIPGAPSTLDVTFATAFPNGCKGVWVQSSTGFLVVSAFDRFGFTASHDSGSSATGERYFAWGW